MGLALRAEFLSVVNLWIDESNNTQDYFRGCTGTMLIIGKGAVFGVSLKQKLNSNISSEG